LQPTHELLYLELEPIRAHTRVEQSLEVRARERHRRVEPHLELLRCDATAIRAQLDGVRARHGEGTGRAARTARTLFLFLLVIRRSPGRRTRRRRRPPQVPGHAVD